MLKISCAYLAKSQIVKKSTEKINCKKKIPAKRDRWVLGPFLFIEQLHIAISLSWRAKKTC